MYQHISAAMIAVLAGPLYAQQITTVPDASPKARYERDNTIQASILLQDARNRSYREADWADTFFNGQRFRLELSANRDGYLYVLCENSQGSAVVLYPNHLSEASNHVRESRRVTVPDNSWLEFDQEPGTERVYILLAEHPIAALERAAQRGSELTVETLERYTRLPDGDSEGVVRGDKGEVVVRRVELRHESRSTGAR